MADTLKVFASQTNQTATASLSSVSIPLASTNSSTRAVIKDVAVTIRNTDSEQLETYNYPTKLKVDGVGVSTSAVGRDSIYTGSLVLDTSSNLTLEIQPEAQFVDYGTMRLMAPNASGSNTYYEANITSSPQGQASTLLTQANAGRATIGGYTAAYTATGFFKNGTPLVAYANNSSNVYIIDTSGASIATVNMGVGITAVASDATYVYCHGPSAQTHIKRIRISDFVNPGNLNLNGNFPSFGTSNPGWIDHYDGHVYMRHSGSANEVYKANTSNGTLTNFNTGHSPESEHIGGRITVNTSNVAYIVEFNDTRFHAYNLDTGTISSQPNAASTLSPWTEPTTTTGNHSATIAPGIVLFLNRSYNQAAVLDVNGLTGTNPPSATLATTIFPTGSGNTTTLIAGWPMQTGAVSVPRSIEYDVYVGGVEVT